MDQSVINFAVYEDGNEYLGMAEVTLPEVNFLTQTISGAGIGGNVEAPMPLVEAMTMSLTFRTMTKQSMKLSTPGRHTIDLRVAQQNEDPVSGTIETVPVKHIMVLVPKSSKGGTIAPASPSNGSCDFAVRYWKTFIDGKKVREIDPYNYKCEINGVDYLADTRKALGK